ncbi:hypothetical protein KVR01_006057 [Diaporthe batatas]|uniref:uncharacterized protein n=1 Tax=Diaporthe batatas TaxID=748121 RepID=UPI001D040FC0|nr:uncharacterized protein KVR01_006057 [Diaporthe batatas]KAG8164139.1 hypothetical protein KVR01_006057 [Diaporthe batatas]
MEHPAPAQDELDEERQEQDSVRLSRLCRALKELLADVSGPLTPQSFLDDISSFVTYLPLNIDGTNSGPLYFLPRTELDQEIKDALASTWHKLDDGNADWVYPDWRSGWFIRGWGYVIDDDHDWAYDAASKDWYFCSRRNEVLADYGLDLPCYSHPPNRVPKWEYMSDFAFLPRKDDVPHLACVLSDTNGMQPSQPNVTLGEMHAILALLAHPFACGKYSEHSIKPAMIFAFQHDRYARITQAHFDCDRERVVIRQSRAIDLRDETAPEDAFILLRWMLSTPTGDTKYKKVEENHKSPETEPPPDADQPLSNAIEVR